MVSSEPIVLFGPGSEWFWSMAQFAVVAVTLVGIYYQFRLQRAANAFDQLNRIAAEWGSEPMLRAKLQIARAIVAGEAAPEGAVAVVGNYWETVASLVRSGHVDDRVVYESVGGDPPFWWAAVMGAAREMRLRLEDPEIFGSFEWLAGQFGAYAAKDGGQSSYDQAKLARVFTRDVERGIMAIGGELHADEEAVLLDDGGRQADLWGINLYPESFGEPDFVEFDSMINVRPRLRNRSRSVDDETLRGRILEIVERLVSP